MSLFTKEEDNTEGFLFVAADVADLLLEVVDEEAAAEAAAASKNVLRRVEVALKRN